MSYKTTNTHRGWQLVETAHNYYHACKGNLRVVVGSIRRGDREELTERFKKVVDRLEDWAVTYAAGDPRPDKRQKAIDKVNEMVKSIDESCKEIAALAKGDGDDLD